MNRILLSACCFLCSLILVSCAKDADRPKDAKTESAGNGPATEDEKLDILRDYDRDLWSGPDGWSQEQWDWKRKLRWDHECDYVGDVEIHPLAESRKLIKVTCVPGAYQPMQYLFIYHEINQKSVQLRIDGSLEIDGEVEWNPARQQLTITSFSRGTRDCGSFGVYSLDGDTVKLTEKRERACSETPLPENPPAEIFEPEKWPTVD